MSEIHLPVAFAEYYNRVEKREKKLQNIIFEHARNVSWTCPQRVHERVPKIQLNDIVSENIHERVHERVRNNQYSAMKI